MSRNTIAHTNKRRRIEHDLPLTDPNALEQSLTYINSGDTPLFRKSIELARSIDAAILRFELTHINTPGYSRFHGFADQIQSSAHSVAANIARGLGNLTKTKMASAFLMARGSLYETVFWVPFFGAHLDAPAVLTTLNQLRANLDEFLIAFKAQRLIKKHPPHPRNAAGNAETKAKLQSADNPYPTEQPELYRNIQAWSLRIHESLATYIEETHFQHKWRAHTQYCVEDLSKSIGAIGANLIEGWARCNINYLWQFLSFARGKFFVARYHLESLPPPFSTVYLAEWSTLRVGLDAYCDATITQIITHCPDKPDFSEMIDDHEDY
jgi:four helix bundle protein